MGRGSELFSTLGGRTHFMFGGQYYSGSRVTEPYYPVRNYPSERISYREPALPRYFEREPVHRYGPAVEEYRPRIERPLMRFDEEPRYLADRELTPRVRGSGRYAREGGYSGGFTEQRGYPEDRVVRQDRVHRDEEFDRYDDSRAASRSNVKVGRFTVYQFPVSVNCLQVTCFLADAGVPYETVDLKQGTMKGGHKHADFLAVNPQGLVPTLTDRRFVVWESMAIMRYISNAADLSSQWYPKEPKERAIVEMAMDWRQSSYYHLLADMTYPYLGFKPDMSGVEAAKKSFLEACEFFTTTLLHPDGFILGRRPCVADYAIAVPLEYVDAVPGFSLPRAMQAYRNRFASQSRNLDSVAAQLREYIASKKKS
eukprot:NODE_875_length_1263_cov_671.873147_g670_i0.p1 GENE.NODE_875_length_1263_cov_671.873147_g670_i0~~NODE_875_length_1263_cov_671.873147_g670_i0.p1  ORF type:complete len:369 (+),score=38.16 NODE_875_length_1263_cov_671.873147_g670_i0:29-1135(+)